MNENSFFSEGLTFILSPELLQLQTMNFSCYCSWQLQDIEKKLIGQGICVSISMKKSEEIPANNKLTCRYLFYSCRTKAIDRQRRPILWGAIKDQGSSAIFYPWLLCHTFIRWLLKFQLLYPQLIQEKGKKANR